LSPPSRAAVGTKGPNVRTGTFSAEPGSGHPRTRITALVVNSINSWREFTRSRGAPTHIVKKQMWNIQDEIIPRNKTAAPESPPLTRTSTYQNPRRLPRTRCRIGRASTSDALPDRPVPQPLLRKIDALVGADFIDRSEAVRQHAQFGAQDQFIWPELSSRGVRQYPPMRPDPTSAVKHKEMSDVSNVLAKAAHALRAISQRELADVVVLLALLATAEDVAAARRSILAILDAPPCSPNCRRRDMLSL
jgi:hypothetical protein